MTERDLQDQRGKVHVVTGGYSGIGYELVKILYAAGATVCIAGRDEGRAKKAIHDIEDCHPSSHGALHFLQLDLADLVSVRSSADNFQRQFSRLDVLVNNAGIMVPPLDSRTTQGHEYQLGVNCLGPFLFTILLMPLLQKTATVAPTGSVRVLWAASIAVELAPPGGIEIMADGAPQTYGDAAKNYSVSKVANALLAVETARRFGSDGIISVAFNPGNLKTPLQRHMAWWQYAVATLILHQPILGAYTELFAGWSDAVTPKNNGAYILPWGRIGTMRDDIAQAVKQVDEGGVDLASRIWEWCERTTSDAHDGK